MARRRFIVALIAVFCAAPAAAQRWIGEEDGDHVRASITTKDLRVTFSCARSGPRPGFGQFKVEALKASIGESDRPVEVRLQRGGRVASVAMEAHGATLAFRHEADAERAAMLAAIVRFMTSAGGGVKLSAQGAEWTLPLANAAQTLKNMDRGCIDFLPEPEDEEQGPWHQGISETEKGPLILLMTQSARIENESRRLNITIVCDAGAMSAKIISSTGAIKAPIDVVWTSAPERAFQFVPGDNPDEASLSREASLQLARGLMSGRGLAVMQGGAAHDMIFDTHDFARASRHLRKICAIPEPVKE